MNGRRSTKATVGFILGSVTREGLTMGVGAAACIIAGTRSIVEVPSVALSYIGTDETLTIIHHSWSYTTILRGLVLVFGIGVLLALLYGTRNAAKLRYAAAALLFAFCSLPQILMIARPDIVRDAHLTFLTVDLVVEDMEANFNLQQVDWRRWQDFTKTIGEAISAIPSVPAVQSVRPIDNSWVTLTQFSTVNLGLTRATMNSLRTGFYLSVAGLICFLLGAYSGDPGASLRRAWDRLLVPLAILIVFSGIQSLRLDAQSFAVEAKAHAMRGEFEQALRAHEKSLVWNPLAAYDLSLNEVGPQRARNLMCDSCWEARLEEGKALVQGSQDIDGMVLVLDVAKDVMSEQPGYRYWTASYLTLAGMQKFNEGNVSAADRDFRRSLQAVPFNGLAWYGRALVQNRMGNHARAAHYLGNVLKVQEQVNFTRLTLRAQFILMQSWDKFHKGDLEAAHRLYSLSLTPEAWK